MRAARGPLYEGSVKNLWEVDARHLEFEYTDAYSVFDWGRMPDALPHKGEALAALGAYFFEKAAERNTWASAAKSKYICGLRGDLKVLVEGEFSRLADTGLAHHFIRRSEKNRLLVRRVAVVGPEEHTLGGQALHHYKGNKNTNPQAGDRLIPLEVVFRFGIPQGSSLLERLTPEYAQALGFDHVPREGERFGAPVLEFFTKLEDTDRFLTWEQALNYSGLEFDQFKTLVARTLCLSIWLAGVFETKGLELWDGKFEWALIKMQEGSAGAELRGHSSYKIALVDSIGPDELRLLDPAKPAGELTGTQISKEFLRLFYRKSKWFEAVKQAKKERDADPSLDWKKRVLDLAGGPEMLPADVRAAAGALYPSLALAVTGENPGGAGVPMPQLLERIRSCLKSR